MAGGGLGSIWALEVKHSAMKTSISCQSGAALAVRGAKERGFTLIELLVVVTLLGILYTLCAPSLLSSFERARGRRCGANLLLLENAKDAFLLDHPGQPLTSSDKLIPYLKNGLPQCPSGGSYSNLTDPFARCACSIGIEVPKGENDGVHAAAF